MEGVANSLKYFIITKLHNIIHHCVKEVVVSLDVHEQTDQLPHLEEYPHQDLQVETFLRHFANGKIDCCPCAIY